ncbi:MAG: nuclear transport factor 2 family protein [Novosphingobium sp.]|nr:nuclear transport factor 2 family protein [Novosphingobium sp.]
MDDLERLLAIEAIELVKAKYFLGLDRRDWDLWRREVWTEDARLEVPEVNAVYQPLEAIIAAVARDTADQISVHHGHMPIFDFVSAAEAHVIWAMEDRLYRTPEFPLHDGSGYLHGFGHYHETYVKTERGWRLHASRLARLRVEMSRTARHMEDWA